MSPNVANSLVHDLVEMAKAMEELPKIKEALEIEKAMSDEKSNRIQGLELRALDRATEIDALNSRIRSLEVERDDAELRFLEADERTSRALDFIKATFGNAGSLIQALEPPKPVPVDEPKVAAPDVAGQSEGPLPAFVASTDPALGATHTSDVGKVSEGIGTESTEVPTSQADPSMADATSTVATPSTDAIPQTASSSEGVATNKPFANKFYIDHPGWVSRADWIEGGGTDYSYDWREGRHSDSHL